ncbi:DUF6270 domain-containing protein [Janibacter sp. LM]|uniref:DUF6270 domain-containing protein n=1 Tax=Janibacter sp. LM TaxID=3144845 RepID=UPI0031F609B8
MTERPRIFIYGSCVSRDAFNDGRGDVTITQYVARQSLVSAMSSAEPIELDLAPLPSSFQRRMVRWDLTHRAPHLLSDAADSTDLVLWDLVDERLGLRMASDGRVLTDSFEVRTALVDPDLTQDLRTIQFGEPEHLSRFRVAAVEFRDLLDRAGLTRRVRVLAVPFIAESDAPEADPDPATASRADLLNAQMAGYYSHLEELGFEFIRVPESEARADPDHRWGPAPFHYSARTYDVIRRGVAEAIQDIAESGGRDG